MLTKTTRNGNIPCAQTITFLNNKMTTPPKRQLAPTTNKRFAVVYTMPNESGKLWRADHHDKSRATYGCLLDSVDHLGGKILYDCEELNPKQKAFVEEFLD